MKDNNTSEPGTGAGVVEVQTLFSDFFSAMFRHFDPTIEVLGPVFIEPSGTLDYPQRPERFLMELEAGRFRDRKAYISTAGLSPDVGFNNAVRNANACFRGMHFFILDDIGTKGSHDRLPELLQAPTAMIESSEGNFQYCYAFKEPIRDLFEAQDFIKALYAEGRRSERWDGGGALACKFVRLPFGVHGKTDFSVRCAGIWPERVFDRGEVLEAAGVTPGDRSERVRTTQQRFARDQGFDSVGEEGVVDLALEFLHRRNMVVYDPGSEWITIRCPWAEEHTSGGDVASYSPLGRGAPDFLAGRQFKCHHDHCSQRGTREFLERVGEMDPRYEGLGTFETEALLVRDYGFSMAEDRVINLHTGRAYPKGGFRDGIAVGSYGPWRKHPLRRTVHRIEHRPDIADVIFTDDDGLECFNSYQPPPWKLLPEADLELLQPFFDLLDYLWPVELECAYVEAWIASKIRDPLFRGAILMHVATAEGTGRTTFWSVVRRLLGDTNCNESSFAGVTGQWDDVLLNQLVVVEEATDESGAMTKFTAADNVKRKCDPRPKRMLLNVKGQPQTPHMVTTSWVMNTNNPDAIKLADGARRFFIAGGPSEPHPEGDEFYQRLNDWIDAGGWEDHLFTYFMTLDLEDFNGSAPPPVTDMARVMQGLTGGKLGTAVRAVMENWPAQYISEGQLMQALSSVAARFHQQMGSKWAQLAWKEAQHQHLDMADCRGQQGGVDRRPQVDPGTGAGAPRKHTVYKIRAKKDGPLAGRDVDWEGLREAVEDRLY